MAETGCVEVRCGDLDVHEVPFVANPGRVAVAVPVLVGPRRFTRDVMGGEGGGVRCEKRDDLRTGSRVEVVLGDEGDDLVALVAPSARRTRQRRGDSEKCAREENTLRKSPGRGPGGSIRLASLFLTLPTRAPAGQHVISSARPAGHRRRAPL